MNAFDSLINENVAQAIGWTLIHSTWQIALASLLLAALMVVLNDKSARLRYWVGISTLLAVLITSVITFLSVWESIPSTTIGQSTTTQLNYSQILFESNSQAGIFSTWFNLIRSFLQQHLDIILLAWMIGVVLFSIRLIGGLTYITRLRNKYLTPVSSVWTKKLNRLEERFDLNRKVQLFESALVKIPTIVGHLKPYILVPMGTFSALPADQIEAILAHELAHIKRNDYLINIFQSVLEIIFFFHPAIWWINNTIRKERELCCDDLAVEMGCDAVSLARALTHIEEFNLQSRGLTMAISGKGSLLNRIKRLIGQHPKNSATLNGISAASVLLITAVFMLTINNTEVFSSDRKEKNQVQAPKTIDAIPVQKASLIHINSGRINLIDTLRINKDLKVDDKDALVIVKDDKGEVKEIKVNGKTIPKEKWNEKELQEEINKRSIPVNPHPVGPPHPGIPPSFHHFNLPPTPPFPHLPPMEFDLAPFSFDFDIDEFNSQMTPQQRKELEKKMKKLEKEMETRAKEFEEKHGKEWQKKMEMEWAPQLKNWEMQMNEWSQQAEPQLELMVENLANMEHLKNDFNFNFDVNDNFSTALEQALIEDGLIKQGEPYQFSISGKNDEMTVNGKKQPKSVFEKYEQLIKKSSGIEGDDYSFSISK